MTEAETRLKDWAEWYHYNKDRMPREDLKKRCDFLEKSLDGILEILALQAMEMRERGRVTGKTLYLPTGIALHDNIRA
jgi:hypothetical protein